ncbi:hypothetical protein FP2506_03064 [Fulvimarina pelagi HTCC2506]|uniref:Uncharacterized protein n=1 Tax=Fulvimarina pelagi HTCC2506 TaxID=314231 RepID=Q0G0C0_9HYPH|nr:hypothetical protein FP2506_03064 [Fulvimarina pelagi HTCC2506]
MSDILKGHRFGAAFAAIHALNLAKNFQVSKDVMPPRTSLAQ